MSETNLEDRFVELAARSTLYGALALLFRHPEEEHQRLLLEKKFREWRKTAEVLKEDRRHSLAQAAETLIRRLEKASLAEWRGEHEQIFGHTARGAVPAYELEYGEEHSYREPQELGDIAAFYQAFGLRVADAVHERVDHVAVECEFLRFLTFKEAYALQHDGLEKAGICREAQMLFLKDHLGRWLPVFTLRLRKKAPEGLHGAIADFAFAFILLECKNLGIAPGPRDLPLRALEVPEEISCAACPAGLGPASGKR